MEAYLWIGAYFPVNTVLQKSCTSIFRYMYFMKNPTPAEKKMEILHFQASILGLGFLYGNFFRKEFFSLLTN